MATIAKTTLTSEGSLPRLQRRDVQDIIYYIEECLKYRFNQHLVRTLDQFVTQDLYDAMIEGLPSIVQSKEFQAIDECVIFTTEKRYVYRIELFRQGSNLSAMKTVLKDLLMTSSHLSSLAGRKVRRSTNRYCYTILIDCSDGRYSSPGIHRLARMLYAFNDAEYLSRK